MAVTRIRVPLTDVHGRDVFTGHKVDIQPTDRLIKHKAKTKKSREDKVANAVNGKVHVEGFGYVNI